ncbi:MAG TPA: cytochrome c [Candidatus Baltobacteraceae bacterium]|nr:cytochrome c [Candidatus Baltobacteraceae bacterium]
MLKGFAIGIAFTVVATAIAGYAIIRFGILPANADERPPHFEVWAAKTSLHATLRRSAPRVTDPLAATNENLAAGIKLYAQDCAVCHGDAAGKPTAVAKGLYQKPPQLANDGVEDDPDGVTFWKLSHGIRWTGMPAFGKNLSEKQLWQLTLFLKTMDHLPPAAQRVWQQVRASAP